MEECFLYHAYMMIAEAYNVYSVRFRKFYIYNFVHNKYIVGWPRSYGRKMDLRLPIRKQK